MITLPTFHRRRLAARAPALAAASAAVLLIGPAVTGPARAEKGDRLQTMSLEAEQPCSGDMLRNVSVCSGNVVVAQGTLLIRAERVELRKTPDGYQVASATGTAAKPAKYRQKRDGVDEYIEASAQRIDYDSRANTLRFEGEAVARLLRGAAVGEEVHGKVLTWDNNAEQFTVQGGAPTAANPGGRVRMLLVPAEAASGASAPAKAPVPVAPLRATPALGDRR